MDSDWYGPFPQVVILVSTVASVGRSSDAVPFEKGKSHGVVDDSAGHPFDGQRGVCICCVIGHCYRTKVGLTLYPCRTVFRRAFNIHLDSSL